MPTATGTYDQVDGSPVVRFERTFAHSAAQVWDAISDSVRLAPWPGAISWRRIPPFSLRRYSGY